MPARMVFTENISFDANTTDITGAFYKTNCLYNPNVTDDTSSVNGYNEYKALYDKFTVIGSKIYVSMTNTSIGLNHCFIALFQEPNLTSASIQYILQKPGTKAKICGNNAAGNATIYMSNKWSARKGFGKGVGLLGSVPYQGDAENDEDPVEKDYYFVGTGPVSTLSNPTIVCAVVKVVYLVVWHSPKDIDRSNVPSAFTDRIIEAETKE